MEFLSDQGKTALVHRDEEISYLQLLRLVDRMAKAFNSKAGDRICLFGEAHPVWFAGVYAAFKNQSIIVPLDMMATAEDLVHLLSDSEPKCVVTSRNNFPVLEEALAFTEVQPEILIFEDFEDFSALEEFNADPVDIRETDMDETAVIIYTSGTTGKPKGVMLSYQNLWHQIDIFTSVERWGKKNTFFYKDDVTVTILPLQHILPLMATILIPMRVGATVCLLPAIDTAEIVRIMNKWKVTYLIGVPKLFEGFYNAIMEKINGSGVTRALYGLSRRLKWMGFSKTLFKKVNKQFGGHVKLFFSGGSKISPTVRRGFYALGIPLLEGYGLSETSPVLTKSVIYGQFNTVGVPVQGVEIKIERDEIVARGPNIFQGYYKNPEATQEVLKNGWFYTGDQGRFNLRGYLEITGRIKDIIILGNGKNINPTEIEEKLLEHYPEISELGLTEKDGQLLAVIVPDQKFFSKNQISDLEGHFRKKVFEPFNADVPSYKRVLKFELYDGELPRTRIGKLKRFELLGLVEKNAPKEKKSGTPAPDTEEYRIIREYLEGRLKIPVSPDDHVEFDLGLDSLDRLQFLEKLNTSFGTKLTNEDLSREPVIRNLSKHIEKIKTRIHDTRVEWGKILKERTEYRKNYKNPWMMNLLVFLARPFVWIFFRLRAEGRENLPKEGGYILAPNHQSMLDALVLNISLRKRQRKRNYSIAKDAHFNSNFRRRFARRSNIIIIEQGEDIKTLLQKSATLLKDGNILTIFPEGTRSADGSVGSFKDSFAILASEIGVPVIPVAIRGAFECFPRDKKFPRAGKIHLEFLPPMQTNQKDYAGFAEEVRQKIQKKVQ